MSNVFASLVGSKIVKVYLSKLGHQLLVYTADSADNIREHLFLANSNAGPAWFEIEGADSLTLGSRVEDVRSNTLASEFTQTNCYILATDAGLATISVTTGNGSAGWASKTITLTSSLTTCTRDPAVYDLVV